MNPKPTRLWQQILAIATSALAAYCLSFLLLRATHTTHHIDKDNELSGDYTLFEPFSWFDIALHAAYLPLLHLDYHLTGRQYAVDSPSAKQIQPRP